MAAQTHVQCRKAPSNNFIYFIKEAKDIIAQNKLSTFFSLISTALILFVLALVISGWLISSQVVDAIKGEAEISVYMADTTSSNELINSIEQLQGITSAKLRTQEDATKQMETILGEDAKVLSYFDESPFDAYIEVSIDINQMTTIIPNLTALPNVESIRDNRDILERINQLAKSLSIVSYLILLAVGVTTVVIISHMIRQGIYHHKEQINTLDLLGAPKSFVAIPFYIQGVLLTLMGGVLAIGLITIVLNQLYVQLAGPLPFIPLPVLQGIIENLVIWIMSLSFILGISGCMLGLMTSQKIQG